MRAIVFVKHFIIYICTCMVLLELGMKLEVIVCDDSIICIIKLTKAVYNN